MDLIDLYFENLLRSFAFYSFRNSRLPIKKQRMIRRTIRQNILVCQQEQMTELIDFKNKIKKDHQ